MVREVETDPATERALAWLAVLNEMTVEQVIARWLRRSIRRAASADPALMAAMEGGREN